MNKFFLFVLLSIIFLTPFTIGDQVYNFDATISGREYNHISFTILREVEFEVQGIASGNVSFMAFDKVNYQKWLDLTNYTSIYQTSISGEFKFVLIVSLTVNSTLNMIIYNSGNNPVQIVITIDEIISTSDKSPIPILSISLGLFLVIVKRKTVRSR